MMRAWPLLALLACGGCDDAPEVAPPARTDATMDEGPPDVGPDRGPDAGPADGARPDRAADAGPVDSAVDGATDGPPDAVGDGRLDALVDATLDALVDAAPDAVPDLEPDLPWAPAAHRVFMTAAAFTADFGGVAGADAACADAAAAAGLGGTWRAIISDAEAGARDRLTIVGPIETTAGVRIAQGFDDLWDGAIRAPIDVDARGLDPGGRPDVWTGTDDDGRPDARANSFCSNWGLDDRPLGAVEIGRGDLSDRRWVAFYRDGASAFNCGSEARLYCIDGQ